MTGWCTASASTAARRSGTATATCRPPSSRRGSRQRTPRPCSTPTASAANTHVLAHAGRIWALEEGHLPVRAEPRARHPRLRRLRRQADDGVHRAPEAVPRDRRAALLRLLAVAAVPHLPRPRRQRGARPLGAEIDVPQGTMMHDFMITRDHAIFMDLPVVFDLDEPGGAARVGRQLRRPHRHHAAHGHQRRHPLVRDRPVLRVPPPQRLRRRRHGRLRCRAPRDDVAGLDGAGHAVVPAPVDVRPGSRARSTSSSSTRCRTPSRASTTASSACSTATAGASHRDDGEGTLHRCRSRRQVGSRHRLAGHLRPRADAFPGEFVFVQDDDAAGEDEGWAIGFVYDAADGLVRPRDPRRVGARQRSGRSGPSPATCAVRFPRQLGRRLRPAHLNRRDTCRVDMRPRHSVCVTVPLTRPNETATQTPRSARLITRRYTR